MSARSWLKMFVVTIAALGCFSAGGQINSWTNPISGRWDDFSWSLGVRPNNTHTVTITNAGSKAVAIFPGTPINFPATMTISNLVLSSPTGYANTLLLNYSGTATPLRVLADCSIESGATLVNLYSKLQVDGTNGEGLRIRGGNLVVEGGTIVATNAPTVLEIGDINVTNSSLTLGDFRVGYYRGSMTQAGGTVSATTTTVFDGVYNLVDGILTGSLNIGSRFREGHFNQFGGTNVATNVSVAFGDWESSWGTYFMSGGVLRCNILEIGDRTDKRGEFAQARGMVEAGKVYLGSFSESAPGHYVLTNGVLRSGQLSMQNSRFDQFGGHHTTSNTLVLQGYYHESPYDTFGFSANYRLCGGRLDSPGISIYEYADFYQSGGTNSVSGDLIITDDDLYTLQDGFLCTSNTDVRGPVPLGVYFYPGFTQLGGAHRVSNTLAIPGTYSLLGGNLTCSNLVLTGILTVSNGYADVTISNWGSFHFGGWLRIHASSHTFGVLHVTNNAVVEFSLNPATAAFLSSSAASWNTNTLLIVSNWNGLLDGGGPSRVVVGSSLSGLTPAQLAQVRFVNPETWLAGTYMAKMLSSGEIVPAVHFNSWGSSTSANWDSANWSAGMFPAGNDSVLITNAGSKAVAIQPSTPVNNPWSMTIHDLTIGAPSGSVNTLLLNYSGIANPLHILGGCLIQTNGILNNQFGVVQIDASGDALTVRGGLIQEGGKLLITNGAVLLVDSTATMNNATCIFNTLTCSNALFQQTGGSVSNIGNFWPKVWLAAGSRYVLSNGTFCGSMTMDASSFKQYGGTNYSDNQSLALRNGSNYEITGGTFIGGARISEDSSVSLINATWNGELYVNGQFRQQGGAMSFYYIYVFGNYTQSDGTVQIQLSAYVGGTYQLRSGLLTIPDLDVYGTFLQDAGTNTVKDLSVVGDYSLNGGTLCATNLAIATYPYGGDQANLIISNAPIIINPGQFWLFGKIALVGSTQQLGTLVLSGDSIIDFTRTPGQLKFLNSSAASWSDTATLTISNWVGLLVGNGNTRLVVGTNATGLTSAQLSRIRFVNPAGVPGTFYATMLSTGELIPTPHPYLVGNRSYNSLVLTWPDPFTLESAPNVAGPYALVPDATSPYIVYFYEPRRFFRLKQ